MSNKENNSQDSPTPSKLDNKISFYAYVSITGLSGFRKNRLWIEVGCENISKTFSQWEKLLKTITSLQAKE
jgi:hypothetical protein